MPKKTNETNNTIIHTVTFQDNYFNSKVDYYRNVIRKNNDSYLKKLQKIPDDWDSYESNSFNTVITIPPEQQKRLSEIKKSKTDEYKFEMEYIDHLVLIENTIVSCLNYSPVSIDQLNEAKTSLSIILDNFDSKKSQFKLLLLNNAKKAISDLYYLSLSYIAFHQKENYNFDQHFKFTCNDMFYIINNYESVAANVGLIKKYSAIINDFFYKTQDKVGLRLEDLILKDFYEKKEGDKVISAVILTKIVDKIIAFKKSIKSNFEFLKFYYGDQTGKLFRYNFIINSLTQKFEEKKIDYATLDGFIKIKDNFLLLKQNFEQEGLLRFGPNNNWYYDILLFIYKCCKILEFIYLRSSRYEHLQDLRSDILYNLENEIIYFNKIK